MIDYELFIKSIKDNDINFFKKFIFKNIDFFNLKSNNDYIIAAIEDKRLDFLIFINEYLKIPLNFYQDAGFLKACEVNSLDIVKYYIENKISTANTNDNYGIIVAAENGHVEVFQYLLNIDITNPFYYNDFVLLEVFNNFSLKNIEDKCTKNYMKIIFLLLKDKRVKEYIKTEEDIKKFLNYEDERNSFKLIQEEFKAKKIRNF
jgi:hypothetical protein